MITCKDCKEEKEESFYYEYNKRICKKCLCIKASIYRNREDFKEFKNNYQKKYRLENLEKSKKYAKEYAQVYYKREDIKERRSILRKKKRNDDNIYKLVTNIRSLVYNAINRNGYKKTTKTHDIIGCSFEEFKIYIESKFETWMTWDNYGLYNGDYNIGWDIDHIIPASSALNENDIIKLNHYTNLQPLCSKINRDVKRNKLIF